MVEGKEGLRQWEEAVHIFLSEDHDTAFQRALEIGHEAERSHEEGRRWVESRLAQIVRLDCLGADEREFQVALGSCGATEHLPFEHGLIRRERAGVAFLATAGGQAMPEWPHPAWRSVLA
jgi:hypothetical protein